MCTHPRVNQTCVIVGKRRRCFVSKEVPDCRTRGVELRHMRLRHPGPSRSSSMPGPALPALRSPPALPTLGEMRKETDRFLSSHFVTENARIFISLYIHLKMVGKKDEKPPEPVYAGLKLIYSIAGNQFKQQEGALLDSPAARVA